MHYVLSNVISQYMYVWGIRVSPSANQPKYRSFVPSYNFRKSFLNLKATLTKSITCSIAEVLYTVCITSLVPQIYIVTRRLHQWAAITGSFNTTRSWPLLESYDIFHWMIPAVFTSYLVNKTTCKQWNRDCRIAKSI